MNDHDEKFQTVPERIPAWDAFRDRVSVCTVDPRFGSRGVLDPEVGMRPMTLDDHWRDIDALALHDGVPTLIRVHFDTARNLLLHSWFVFRFQQVAEMHAYASVEFALRRRAGLPLRDRKPGLRALLKRAAEEGWIGPEGFQRFHDIAARRADYNEMEALATGREPDPGRSTAAWYLGKLSDLLPKFRNKLAHGSAVMAPSGRRTIELCCDIINQLFPMAGHSDTPERGRPAR